MLSVLPVCFCQMRAFKHFPFFPFPLLLLLLSSSLIISSSLMGFNDATSKKGAAWNEIKDGVGKSRQIMDRVMDGGDFRQKRREWNFFWSVIKIYPAFPIRLLLLLQYYHNRYTMIPMDEQKHLLGETGGRESWSWKLCDYHRRQQQQMNGKLHNFIITQQTFACCEWNGNSLSITSCELLKKKNFFCSSAENIKSDFSQHRVSVISSSFVSLT